MIAALIDHLWQSTLFAFVAGLLTLALKTNGAQLRYGLWFAASVKFMVPFALLTWLGRWVVARVHPATAAAPAGLQVVRQVVEPFAASGVAPVAAGTFRIEAVAAVHSGPAPILWAVGAVWAVGVAFVLAVWVVRWRRVRAALIASSPLVLDPKIAARASPNLMEPGVVGVFRQVLMFPVGIQTHLSAAELEAVLAHELCHLRRRDNLTAAVHMLVQALFWFHPLVWWIGGRLIAERERACDEGVIRAGHHPRVYAEGILKVCRFYLKSSLACAAGVSGSNLTTRVERIMTGAAVARLSGFKATLMSAAAVFAVAAPLAAGLIAALPAAARTAMLGATGIQPPAPARPAVDVPTPGADGDNPAPAVSAEGRRKRTIVQSLERGAEIVAAPGDALAAAAHIEPVGTPDLHLAALTVPDVALAGGAGEMAPVSAPPSPAAGCRLPVLATFQVDPHADVPLIKGAINGRKVQFIAAVSSRTAVFRPAAKALDILELDGHERSDSTPTFTETGYGWVHDLELDDMPRKVLSSYDVHEDFRMAVTDGGGPEPFNPAAALGAQFWALADDDFDLGAHTISLVRPSGCARADTLPFNGGAYSQTRLLTPATAAIDDVVEVVVDGVPLRAEIDTGSSVTIMTREGALKLGHGWPLPKAEPQGQLATGGQGKILWAKARFKTFSIGEETIQNPSIAVADLYGRTEETKVRRMNGTYAWLRPFRPLAAEVPDMILGADFFHAHHVLISNSRRRVYFVYNGAPIFQ